MAYHRQYRNPAKPATTRYFQRRKARVLKRDKCICYLCGTFIHEARTATVDHIIPSVFGGEDTEENLAACHSFCNYAKGDMSLEQFRQMAQIWTSHRSKYEL